MGNETWVHHARAAFEEHFGPLGRYYPASGDEEEIQLAADWYIARWGAWASAWKKAYELYVNVKAGKE